MHPVHIADKAAVDCLTSYDAEKRTKHYNSSPTH